VSITAGFQGIFPIQLKANDVKIVNYCYAVFLRSQPTSQPAWPPWQA